MEKENYEQPKCMCGDDLRLVQEVTDFYGYNLQEDGSPFPGAYTHGHVMMNWEMLLCMKCECKYEVIEEKYKKVKWFGRHREMVRYHRGEIIK